MRALATGLCWLGWLSWLRGLSGARELEPAACASRFDVRRDQIIRTEESRDMGARYLSELDVGSRLECLRLCCETDACDVFVYEEKGPGSCYLFNCGPPEDFRCKFTAHGNFSSGVLALSRRLAELQDQERLAQRERELASLRSGAGSTAAPPAAPTAAPDPPASAAHAPLTEPPPPPQPAEAASASAAGGGGACSRYQFACRRGGECIAVYNACDGVAQCADGSDEAPELGCPPPAAPHLPPSTAAPPPPRTVPPAPDPFKPLQPTQEEGDSGLEPRWPHRLAQAQPPRRYNDMPHIFSHKGGLLQEPAPPFAPFEAWPRRAWPPAAAPPSGMDGGPGDRAWGPGAAGGPYWPEPDPRRAWPVPQPRPDQEMPAYLPPKTMPELAPEYAGQRHSGTMRDGAKKGAPAPPPPPREEAAPRAPAPVDAATDKTVKETRPAQTQARAASAHSAERHFMEEERAPPDGRSERPPAAVLLLVLGLALTAATGAMLAWRARLARRRLRRGKAPLAHDADYLVNGMYL